VTFLFSENLKVPSNNAFSVNWRHP